MHWDSNTTFSVISGITLLACALFGRDLTIKERLPLLGSGTFFFLYGIWVGHQTSGFFIFPVVIYIVPFGAILYLVASYIKDDNPAEGPPVERPGAVTDTAPPLPPSDSEPPAATTRLP